MLYESGSEEDDVEAQCRLIFEEYKPEKNESNGNDEHTQDEINDDAAQADDASKKKRVAHENADKQNKPIAPFKKTANHVQNAMQVHSLSRIISLI